MNILVTGANGQLGNEMRIVAAQQADNGAHDEYYFTDIAGDDIIHLDITDAQAVRQAVAQYGINCIVNCAAYTNVDKAEDDYDLAEKLNATAVKHLAEAMKEVGGLLIHVSTDYVFGGSQGNTPRTEEEPVNPTGVYGLTKLHGEQAIEQTFGEVGAYVIIRTAWLYSEFGKNFVKTMLALTSSKPALNVVFDQAGTPTYALDLAQAIACIIDASVDPATRELKPDAVKTGIYHYSNEGVCSWYDFTKMIAQYAGNNACDVQPCHSSEFPSKVVRPAYSVLDKTKIKSTFGISIPYWTDSLQACLSRLKC